MSNSGNLRNAMTLLNEALTSIGLKFAIIGGAAVVIQGHDRTTQDIDAIVMEVDELLPEVFKALAKVGLQPRPVEPIQFAKNYRMILVQAPDGTEVDISMGLLPFEWEVVNRAKNHEIGESQTVPVASSEDLIIMKLIAGRPRDLEDVRSLIELDSELNVSRIVRVATEFSEAFSDPGILERIQIHFPEN